MSRLHWKLVMALAVFVGMATTGMRCQQNQEPVTKDLAVLLTTGEVDSAAKGADLLDPSVFLSVEVTIDEIRLVEEDGDRVSVFVGPETANLLDLVGVLNVLETVDVPVGSYMGVELLLSSALVELISNPGVPQAVALPEGGLVFVEIGIEVTQEDNLLIIDFGGVRIIQENGTFTIEPAVTVDVTHTATAQAVGKIQNLDQDNDVFDLKFRGKELVVDYMGAVIFLPGDFDMPSGMEEDLTNGLRVLALGTLHDGGLLEASVIVLLPAEPNEDDLEEVMITDFAFDPPSVQIKVGESVKWTLKSETFHTVSYGMGPEDPLAGEYFDIEFLEFGAMAKIKFDRVDFNTETLKFNTEFMNTRLVIEAGDDEFVVEDVPFTLRDGMAVFPYFSRGAPEESFMVGEVVVMQRPQDEDKVTICHRRADDDDDDDDDDDKSGDRGHTIRVARSAVQAHLAHGDTLGPCQEDDCDNVGDFDKHDDCREEERVKICHEGESIYVSESMVEAHLAHGDTLGHCEREDDCDGDDDKHGDCHEGVKICLEGETMLVSEEDLAHYLELGATLGHCEREDDCDGDDKTDDCDDDDDDDEDDDEEDDDNDDDDDDD